MDMIDPPSPKRQTLFHISISRREFLEVAWKSLLAISGLLGLGGLLRFFSFQPNPPPPTLFNLGPEDQLPKDSILTVPEAQAALIYLAGKFQAFSLICPHLGCTVEAKKDGFLCPCHSSRFGTDGSLIRGPSTRPLRPLRLYVNEQGDLILDVS